MPICSYLVFPEPASARRLAERLAAFPGCDVVPAENADLLILVTDTQDPEADAALRRRIEDLEEVRALVLTFGEVDPDTPVPDPLPRARRGSGLPVVPPQAPAAPGHPSPPLPRPPR